GFEVPLRSWMRHELRDYMTDLISPASLGRRGMFDAAAVQRLIERNDDDKTFRRREIARAGQEVDPLRLGEGPLPIPIGQRKADILARYRVALVDPTESLNMPGDATQEDDVRSYREAVQNTGAIQLKLIPHEKGDGEFDSIRLWYRKATDNPDRWVPLMARAARTNARGREVDVAFVMMVAVQINQGLDEQRMLVPEPGPGEGFAVHVDRLPVEEHIR
ncbi:MAG: asparagine synthase-related protein, partial [Phycisphaerales bacterium]